MAMNMKLKSEIIKNYGHQYKFAEKIGVAESLVSLVLNGRRPTPRSGPRP